MGILWRASVLASVTALALTLAMPASADVGPPPTCPEGQHREYLYGHHCVPNGSHLEHDAAGGYKIVPNGPNLGSPAVSGDPSVAPAPSAAPPSSGVAVSPPPGEQVPPSNRGCGCRAAPVAGSAAASLLGLGLALLLIRRTRRED